MIEWIFERFGVVVFALIVIGKILRAVWRSRKTKAEHEVGHDDAAETRRVKEIQEQIRRRILERRRGDEAAPPPLEEAEMDRPIPRPQTTQMPEPFGGPLGRMLEELQKKAQAHRSPPPVVAESRHRAEVERQEQLAEELRVLEETRVVKQRRADHVAEEAQAHSQSEGVLRSAARERLLDDLSEPDRLRRAFVLREVLGPPVGLR